MINRICIFAGSSDNCAKIYHEEAFMLGKKLAEMNVEIIYGGGKVGLMGSLSSGALSSGGRVIGVIPQFMQNLELGRKDVYELHEVGSMHEREAKMMIESDAIAALPGGIGTFEEITQAIAWKLLGLIIKPIYIVNINNYFSHLLAQFDKAIDENFMKTEHNKLWQVVTSVDELIAEIKKLNGNKFPDFKSDVYLT